MSTAVRQFHEEEAIGKTYDLQIARRLLRYLKPYVRLLIPALALTLALNLLGALQPKFTQFAIDWNILPRKTDGLSLLVGLFLLTQVLQLIFSYFQSIFVNTVGQYVMFDIRKELYHKLQHQEVAYYDRNPVGRVMTRLTADVDALNQLFTEGVTDLLGDLVTIFAIISVMLWMDVQAHAHQLVDGSAARCRNHLVSKRRTERLRPGAHTHRAHQRFFAGTFCRRANGSDLQRRSKVSEHFPDDQRSSIVARTSKRSSTTRCFSRSSISSAQSVSHSSFGTAVIA